MKANELRIGNYVKCPSLFREEDIYKVISIDKNSIGLSATGDAIGVAYDNEYDEIAPIPLTLEILLQLGFTINPKNGLMVIEGNISKGLYISFALEERQVEGNVIYVFPFEVCNVPLIQPLKYVHELQNLFFALEGRELMLENK